MNCGMGEFKFFNCWVIIELRMGCIKGCLGFLFWVKMLIFWKCLCGFVFMEWIMVSWLRIVVYFGINLLIWILVIDVLIVLKGFFVGVFGFGF